MKSGISSDQFFRTCLFVPKGRQMHFFVKFVLKGYFAKIKFQSFSLPDIEFAMVS